MSANSGKVIELFGPALVEKVVPPVRQPNSLAEFSDVGQIQVQRSRQTNTMGTFLALAAGVGVFFLVRDWRQTKRARSASKGSMS